VFFGSLKAHLWVTCVINHRSTRGIGDVIPLDIVQKVHYVANSKFARKQTLGHASDESA